MRIHSSITSERLLDAAERSMTSLDNPGFCIACGEDADSCEPDAERYLREACGARGVYGADQLIILIA